MPIITPAYPSMCATHNVTASTQMIMTEEFKKGQLEFYSPGRYLLFLAGSEIVDRVIVGSADWSELFSKHDFFHKYRYYLQVIASTGSSELQIKWYGAGIYVVIGIISQYSSLCRAGTVESRIRQLVMKLEYVDSLTLAHPFIKGFEQVLHCLSEEELRAAAQGDVSDAVAKRKKEEIEGKEGASSIYLTSFYIGLAIEPKQGACIPECLTVSDYLSSYMNV